VYSGKMASHMQTDASPNAPVMRRIFEWFINALLQAP
jgi:hypothetical protein